MTGILVLGVLAWGVLPLLVGRVLRGLDAHDADGWAQPGTGFSRN